MAEVISAFNSLWTSFTALTAAGSFPRLPVLIEAINLKADVEVFTALKRAASDSISSGELILKSSGKSENLKARIQENRNTHLLPFYFL